MKRLISLLLLSLSGLLISSAHAQGMVSLSMGQPGFYGRIDVGSGYPQPPLLFPNALMGNPGVFSGQPIYMHVPPHHAHYWSSHCQLYGACDWMVYFVDNRWYNDVYVPGFRSGAFAYAPPPVYIAPPIYAPRPYYGHHHHHGHGNHYGHGHHGHHHYIRPPRPPNGGGHPHGHGGGRPPAGHGHHGQGNNGHGHNGHGGHSNR